jgi:uncharacterized protein with HEPN domain/predicted nucleotidyltransferase
MVSPASIEEFCRRWGIAELALFGSLARGDFREDSDADVLVTFAPETGHSFPDRFAMTEELQKLFGREVDLVEQQLIVNPFRRHNILLDKRVLYPVEAAPADEIRDGEERFERDIGLVWDIVRTARQVREAIAGRSFEDYKADWILRAAVERLLITIGEASRAFSEPFRAAHPEIPWSGIISERNILVHQYTEIKDQEVWKIATLRVPKLLLELQPLLPLSPES